MTLSVFRPELFQGKVALVTGGGTGIGKAIASELKSLGCNVVISSRKEDNLKAACAELESVGSGKIAWVSCDIKKPDQIESMIQYVLETFSRLDFLVNNSGGQFPMPAGSISPNGFRTVVDLNLNGTFCVCKSAYDEWFFEHGGSIVNIIANYFNGFPMMAHTGAARAGVANLTKTLASEWACAGIRVNSVAPGVIYSDTAQKHYETKGEILGDDPLGRTVPSIPAKRLGTVQEVASSVVFLLSPGASYITGTIVRVDGGQSQMGHGSYNLADTDNYPVYGNPPPKPKL